MLKMLKMLPLLMLETAPKAENESDPDFFGVFSKMQETLDAINTKLTPAETATPAAAETPVPSSTEPPESETLETPASQHKEPEKETESVEVEEPQKPKGKSYPWKAAR